MSRDKEAAKTFLLQNNKGPTIVLVKSRTVVLMDATGSMANLLHKVKASVEVMFSRAYQILRSRNVKEDSFSIQFVFYRNYNSKEDKLLQYSGWEINPDNLREFTASVRAEAGTYYSSGREAIEIGLWYANQENARQGVSQVILIGDYPANTDSEISTLRTESGGEEYWKTTKFNIVTNYITESEKLKENKIPVHAYYVASKAKENFEEIAGKTGGRSAFLDVNS